MDPATGSSGNARHTADTSGDLEALEELSLAPSDLTRADAPAHVRAHDPGSVEPEPVESEPTEVEPSESEPSKPETSGSSEPSDPEAGEPARIVVPVQSPPEADEPISLEAPETPAADAEPVVSDSSSSEVVVAGEKVPNRHRPFALLHFNRLALLITGAILAVVVLLAGAGTLLFNSHNASSGAKGAGNYSTGKLSLGNIQPSDSLEMGNASQLSINGLLKVNDSLVLVPTTAPTSPVAGQFYYNKADNTAYFYNGTQFVNLAPVHVSSLGGQAGAITLDSSLQITNNNLGISSQLLQQIENAGNNGGPRVTSLQGLSGAVTLNGGSGIAINGTTISNSGLISLTSGSGNLVIGNDGAGHYTITDTGGGGSVTSLTGTPNQVNVSSSTGNVTLSLPQDIAVASAPTFGGLTVTGDAAVQGAGGLTLGNGGVNGKLTFSSSGGGSIALQSGSMATNLAFTLPSVDGSNGYCLKTNGGGTLSFQQCTGGPGGGVSSLNNQTDIVVLNNATGSGGFITIDNAKADGATKGIATFNSTNFIDDGSGAINTVQGISTAATPTFAGLTINGTATATTLNATSAIQLNGTDINLAGTLNNVAYLNGTGPQIFSGNNKFTGTVTAQLTSPTAFQVQDGLGTSNLFVANTSTDRVGIGTLGPGYKLDVQGGDINTSGIYRVNGAQISSAALSNDSNLAKLNAANVFSAANTFSSTVSIQGANSLTLGSGTNIGSIIFRDGSSGNTGTLQLQGVLSGNVTYSLPTATGSQTVCTVETGNCAGSGSGITGSGTINKLAKFTGSQAIGDSSISDDGTVVTVSTGQIVQGAAGLTIGTTGVDGKIVLTNSVNSNTLTLQSGATTGNLTLTLPTADGSNGNCLKTNGSGVLSFAACTGGPGGGVTSINTLTGVLNIVGTANQVSVSSAGDTITLSLPQDINTGGNANFRTVTLTGQAAGDNLIVGNAVSGATGNLIDLKVNNVSQFTVTPNGNVNTVGQYQVNGVQIASSNLSDGSNLAKLNGTGPQVFTGNNQFTGTTQVKLDSPAAFSVENSTGTSHLLVADTTTSRIGIGTNTPGYPLDVNGDVNTSGVYRINGVTVCSASGCTPSSGSGSYIQNGTSAQTANFNITGTGVIGTSLTTPSVTSTGALSIQAGGTNSSLTLDSNGTGAITLGNGASSKAITIGNTTGTSQVNIQAGSGNAGGDINVGNAALASGTRLINIGATASTTASTTINIGTSNSLTNSQNVNIGTNVAGNSSVLIQAGTTGSVGLQVGAGGTINVGTLTNNVLNLGTGAVAGTIKIGGTGQTGTLTVGQSTATNTISIGSAAGNGNTQTINIGTSATAGSTTNLTLGSTIAGTVTLQGATVKQTVSGGSVTIQNVTTNSATAFQIQNTSGGNVFVADTANSRVGVNTGTIALNTNLNVYNGGASTIQTQFTQNLRDAGINVMSDYIQDAYTAGLFWSTQNNNPTSPKAGIYTQLTNNGSKLLFGTSASYAAGLTNTALTIGYNGDSVFRNGTNTPTGFQIQNAAGAGLFTVDTTTGAALTSSLYVDVLGSGGTTALCWNASLQVSTCSGAGANTLQGAYTGGNIINLAANTPIEINAPGGGGSAFELNVTSGNSPFIDWNNGTASFGIRSDDNALHLGAWDSPTGSTFYNTLNVGADQSVSIQNASGDAALNVDTANMTTTLQAGTDSATLGSELFTGSTHFTSGSGWTTNGLNGQSASITHTTGTTAKSPTPAISVTSGNYYLVSWDVTNPNVGGSLTVTLGGQTVASYTFDDNESGSYTFTTTRIIQASSSANLAFTPNSAFTGTISNVTIKQLTYNDKPVLVINNTSGAPNLEVRASSSFDNLFIGDGSGAGNVTGDGNLALGTFTLQNNVSGDSNTALGQNALQNNVSGDDNVGIGFAALNANVNGNGNVGIGSYALNSNIDGSDNIAIGLAALQSNVDGFDNVALGRNVLGAATTASYNLGIGAFNLQNVTTAGSNIALGYSSLRDTTDGYNNNSLGVFSMEHNTTGADNVAIGTETLDGNLGGSQNVVLGNYSMFNNTSGSYNVALGTQSLEGNISGSYNTAIGREADVIYSGLQNATVIGAEAEVGSNDTIILGYSAGRGVYDHVGIGTSYAQNPFEVAPNTYDTGTISQSSGSGNVVGSGTTFTAQMVGATLFYSNGSHGIVTGFTDATHITSSNTTGGWSGADYAIVWGGFNVNTDASVWLQNTTDSQGAFAVVNQSGTVLLNVNTSNSTVNIAGVGANGGGGRLTFGDYDPTTDLAAFVGEEGTGDTDILQVNGANGVHITSGSYSSPETVGAFSYDSGRDSGVLSLGETTSGGYLEFDNNNSFKWSIGMDSANACSGSTPADTLYFYTNVVGGCAFQLASGGQTIFKSVSSNSAFQIQNSGGNPLFNLNSTSNAITLFSGVTGGTLTTDIAGTKTSNAVCHSGGSGANENVQIVACTGSIVADYAENYPVASGVDYGDIVVTGSQMVDTYNADTDGNADWSSVKGQVTQLVKSSAPYQTNTIGIVSDNHNNFTSAGNNIKAEDNPMPVALNGRVPVNVALGSGAIQPGDYLTTSGDSGKAMKATQAGFVIGKALEAWDPASGKTQVMVFVEPGYWPGPSPSDMIQNGGNAMLANLNVSGVATINDLTVTGAATIADLTVTGSAQFAGNITVGGHIITAGGQPTSQAEAAAGSAASVSVDGTDTTGTITITTGATPTAGDLAKILFSQTYGKAPHVVLSASNDKAAALHFYKGATSPTDFMFTSLDAPAPNTIYTFDYVIAQ